MTAPLLNHPGRSGFSPAPQDTIFAVASGQGRAAIAVVRLSGPTAGFVLDAVAGGRPTPRRAALRRLRDPATGETLDRGLVLWMPGPDTFTGEDQAELHLHGGLAVRAAVLRALSGLPGCRTAEPGEFARRAFLNERLDLAAVEGVADLVDAETEAQRRQALRQLEGDLSRHVLAWRDRLVDALALHEAGLDFTDEDDVPADVEAGAASALAGLRDEIGAALAGAGRGERIRDGFLVVIAGPPNAGKSTLLNAVARREVAIVSPVPGTTRDAIELRCDLGGLPVTLVDTAGLRDGRDPVEREGVARASARIRDADLVLWLSPADAPAEPPPMGRARLIRVGTKADLGPPATGALAVSARTGDGLPALLDAIRAGADATLGYGGDAVVTRERHRVALEEVGGCLDRAIRASQMDAGEFAAEDLRLALRALGRITGEVGVEDILDRIFTSFCIGK